MELRLHLIPATEIRDNGERIEFDAVDWFDAATEQQIRELRAWGYRVICCELIPDEIHCPGFEIVIESDDAEAWLAKHRPEVLR